VRIVFFGTAGAVPRAGDGNISFAVREGGACLLVDASGSPVQNLLRAGLDPLSLDALALTHSHTDHLYALPSLIHCLWLMKRSKPLTILTNPPTREKAVRLLEEFGLLEREGLFPVEWIDAENRDSDIAADLRVRLFPVRHSVPTSGLRIEGGGAACAYTADTAPAPEVDAAVRGCQALIHEASGDAAGEPSLNAAGHSSAGQAGQAAARAGAGRLFLCHFDYRSPQRPEDLLREARSFFPGEVIIPNLFQDYEIRRTRS
jgi:ribonuclease Z